MSIDSAVRGLSGTQADVDANNSLKTTGPLTPTQAGMQVVGGAVLDSTGKLTKQRPAYITENNRQSVAQTAILWDDTFNSTALNTSKYKFFSTTQTGAQAGGFLTLNNSGITTINTNCAVTSARTFPLIGNSELRVVFSGGFAAGTSPSANNTCEIGLMAATLPGGAIPLDGVFFRWNNAAELRGVINYNGTETQTSVIPTVAYNVNHDFMIVIQTNVVSFYIDAIFQGSITLTTDAPTLGQPCSMATLPITMRNYIGGSAPGTAVKWNCSDVFVTLLGPDTNRTWNTAKAGMGHMAYQGQNGGTMGTTALFTNSLAVGAGVALTNTTAAAGVGLGGQFSYQPTLAAGTDGILCSYQNPAGSVTQTPRSIIISGISIQGAVTIAHAGGGVFPAYSLAYGHTAVSMATAETASFTSGGAKAPRRIALGFETYPVTAAVGTLGSTNGGVQFRFDNPIVVAPGEFVAVCSKNLGVVTSAGVITVLITFDAVYE